MNDDELEELEDELKNQEAEEEIADHKVSGRSVFEIERIIKERSEEQDDQKDKNSQA